ncbi:hypothetical protein BDV97DRAFT_294306 [Delphinella strobiligena]|nr:hypothetical protein BDV97DRAFT_294306 [Delphinella strobiligena]
MSTAKSRNGSTTGSSWAATTFRPQHSEFPYTEADFRRHDPTSDQGFYSTPRFVTHIDDAAIKSLGRYYDAALPLQGRILDFCSSWVSHYPERIENACKKGDMTVVGMGMNDAEFILQDLNVDPSVPIAVCGEDGENGMLNASTCVVSIDYLIHPLKVLSSLRSRTAMGGSVHLVVSNRCFPTKATSRWLRSSEEERLVMVANYLWFSGWRNIELLDIKAGDQEGHTARELDRGGLHGFMSMVGLGHEDPLWVVRGTRTD